MREFKAAILTESRSPLVVDTIAHAGDLEAGQVLVRIRYSGICGAQINEIDAVKGPDKFLPHLLGHEGIGEVVEVGPLVRSVASGDTVVLHWMPGEGIQSNPARYTWRGAPLNAGWVTTLSEFTVVSENRVTRLESDLDPRYVPLLGCAATTAWGSLVNDAGMRLGDSVVVLGAGGVGLLVVEAARAGGAHPIIAVDQHVGRINHALEIGADQAFLKTTDDLEVHVRKAIGGFHGPDVVIETTGAKEMIELAYRLVADGGRAVLVGVPRHDEPASFDTLDLHFGMSFTGSKGGGVRPQVDVPRLADLASAGIFRLTALPVTILPLEAVNDGITAIRSGSPGRVVIDMNGW